MPETNGVITVKARVDFKPTVEARKAVAQALTKPGINIYNQNILPCSPLTNCDHYKRGRVVGVKWCGEFLTLDVVMDKPEEYFPQQSYRWHLTGRCAITGDRERHRLELFVYYF